MEESQLFARFFGFILVDTVRFIQTGEVGSTMTFALLLNAAAALFLLGVSGYNKNRFSAFYFILSFTAGFIIWLVACTMLLPREALDGGGYQFLATLFMALIPILAVGTGWWVNEQYTPHIDEQFPL